MKRILCLLIALSSLTTMAQQYPVSSISITLPPQPAPNIGDWSMPFLIAAQARLVNGQVPGNLIESRILVTIKKNGSRFCGNYTQQNAPMSVFNSPTKTWSGGAAINLVSTNCEMPAGTYELCVQFFTSSVPAMPLSNEVCKSFIIQERNNNPTNYTHPQNILPFDGKQFSAQEGSLPIQFRWTPVTPKPKSDVIYTIRLYEIMPGQSKIQALGNAPIEEKEVRNETQTTFRLGKRSNGIVWVVEAVSADRVQGGAAPKNYGKSEATQFGIAVEEPGQTFQPPLNVMPVDGKIFSATEADKPILFRWTPVVPKPKLDVQYKVRIYEVPKGASKAEVVRSGTPFETVESKNITQAPVKLSKRCNGCEYVWNVEASKRSQLGDIEMLGTSEASTFRINSPNVVASNDCDCIQVEHHIVCNGSQYELKIDNISVSNIAANACSKKVTSWKVNSSNSVFTESYPSPQNLDFGKTMLNTNGIVFNSVTGPMVELNYEFTLDDQSTCSKSFTLELPVCNLCNCVTVVNQNISCQGTTADGHPQYLFQANISNTNCPTPVSSWNITSPDCDVSDFVPQYLPVGNTTTGMIRITHATANPVTLVYHFTDPGGITCNITRTMTLPVCPPPPSCACASLPTIVKRTAMGGMLQEIPFFCNPPTPYVNKLNCNGNDTIIVKNFCTGTCPAQSASLSIKRPDGTTFSPPVFSTGPNEVWFILPPIVHNGIYSMTVTTTCGNQTCSNCVIDFEQVCGPEPCACGYWESVTLHPQPAGIMPDMIKNCSDTFSIPHDMFFYFSGYKCIGLPGPPFYCRDASYKYDVFKSDGTQIFADITTLHAMDVNDCNDVYRIVLKPQCGANSCTPCTVYLKRDCPPSCVCGLWGDARLNYVSLNSVYSNAPVSCGKGITVDCNKQVTINSADFTCSGQCPAVVTVKIYKPSGAYLMGSVGLPIVFTPTIVTGDPYKVVLEGTCDGNSCESCTLYITPKCTPCNCGNWQLITYRNLANGSQGTKICGEELEVKQNDTYSFSTSLSCTSQGSACTQTASYSLYFNGNLIARPKTGFSISSLKFDKCGNYEIRFDGTCDASQCQCILRVRVDCCSGRKIKMYTNDNIDITQSTNCVSPGQYLFKLDPDLPANTVASYQLITLSDNVVVSQGSYPAGGKWLSIPPFTCDASQFKMIINWNGTACGDTLIKFLCQPPCCDYIALAAVQPKSLSGSASSQVLDFESKFDLLPGATVKWNKIKVQILAVSVDNTPRKLANISQLQVSAPFTLLSTLTNNNAIIQGDAIWFNTPLLSPQMPVTAPNQIVFKGKIFSLMGVPNGAGSVKLKLRYTFYRNNGSCNETICEKTIDY